MHSLQKQQKLTHHTGMGLTTLPAFRIDFIQCSLGKSIPAFTVYQHTKQRYHLHPIYTQTMTNTTSAQFNEVHGQMQSINPTFHSTQGTTQHTFYAQSFEHTTHSLTVITMQPTLQIIAEG